MRSALHLWLCLALIGCSRGGSVGPDVGSQLDELSTPGEGVTEDLDVALDTDAPPDLDETADLPDAADLPDSETPDTEPFPDASDAETTPSDVPDVPDTVAPTLAVTAALPLTASFRGGATLTLTVSGVTAAPTVLFGEAQATVIATSATTIEVTVPPAAVGGLVPIRVTSGAATATFDGFRYLGISPPLLRLVEVPAGDSAQLITFETTDTARIATLRVLGGVRIAVVVPGAVHLLEPAAGGLSVLASTFGSDSGARGVCVADFDGDLDDDLWIAAGDGSSQLYRHDDEGLVPPAPADVLPLGATDGVCGEFSGDDHADVIVAGAGEGGKPVLRTLIGDGELFLDLVPNALSVGGPVSGLAAADVDGDNHGDLLVGRVGLAPRLLLGDGLGALVDALAGVLPSGGPLAALPALSDLTGDGLVDALLIAPSSAAALWVGDGAGHLTDASGLSIGLGPTPAKSVTLADIDSDGAPDVLVLGPSAPILLRNDGEGRLFDYSGVIMTSPGAAPITRVTAVDVDGDYDLDLVALRNGGIALLRNWDPSPFLDPDGDLIPSELDDCPKNHDPAQKNHDIVHFECATTADCEAETGCQLTVSDAGRAYLACRGKTMGHAAARAFCAERGATLWFPDSPEEQAYVAGLGGIRAWMDMTDAGGEGTFVSSSGFTPPFTSWGTNQPDDAGGNEDCVELIANDPAQAPFWNDLPCDYAQSLVCEDVLVQEPPDPADACDVCPDVYDPAQIDTNKDGVGDACTPQP